MNKNVFSCIVRAGLILACLQISLTLTAQNTGSTCSLSAVQGTYVFAVQGSIIGPNNTLIPLQITGVEVYDGTEKSHGFSSTATVVNGQAAVQSDVPFNAVHSVNANCTMKETITDGNGNVFHFDVFIGPNGAHMTFVATDPGVVAGGTATRDSDRA
jgi:hypothetical protein